MNNYTRVSIEIKTVEEILAPLTSVIKEKLAPSVEFEYKGKRIIYYNALVEVIEK